MQLLNTTWQTCLWHTYLLVWADCETLATFDTKRGSRIWHKTVFSGNDVGMRREYSEALQHRSSMQLHIMAVMVQLRDSNSVGLCSCTAVMVQLHGSDGGIAGYAPGCG
jgi:hypothetical protein